MNKKIATVSISMVSLAFLLSTVSASALVSSSATGDVQIAPTSVQVMPVSIMVGDTDPTPTSTCLDLVSTNLRYKATDANTNNEVSSLQDFLISVSLLKTQSTGYFGLSTYSSVRQFQKMVGLTSSGYVGPLTKAKIKDISCNGVQFPIITNVPQSSVNWSPTGGATTTRSGHVACSMIARMCPDGTSMPRNQNNCEWLDWKCGELMTASATPPMKLKVCAVRQMICNTNAAGTESCYEICAPSKPETNTQPEVTSPPILGTSTPPHPTGIMCTMEARLCPNGALMPRNMTNCEWLPSSCTAQVPNYPGPVLQTQ